MQFRVRPASKRNNLAQLSLLQFPTSKSLAGGESPLPRSVASRIDQLQASISHMQELHKRQRQISNAGYIQVQKRLDKVEYKLFATQQDLRQLNQIRQIKQPRQNLLQLSSQPSKNEIMLLKQVLVQEKQAQRDSIKHLHAQLQQINLKMLRQEQETRELVGHQRMEMEHRLTGQGEELREIQNLKQRKIQQQYDMMKGVIASAEKKIFQELERKIRNETVVKDFMEEKIAEVKEELSREHRRTLASETKFIKETKQSLETLFALINSSKKQLSQELSQTQKLTTSSIKKLSMTLDIAREKSNDQIKQTIQMHQGVANEIVELRNFVTSKLEENRQSINQFQEQTIERMDQGGSSSKVSVAVDSERLSQLQKEMNQWKNITQQKNLNVFKQISNTLKAMKLQWRKENDELVCQVAAVNQSLKALKKAGPSDMKKSVQALVSVFNNEFDVLAEQLETMTDMISLAKKENQKTFKESLNKLRTELTQQIKNVTTHKSKENNQYTDKCFNRSEQNMKIYVEKQVKFMGDGLSQKIQKSETLLRQLQSAMKKANILTTAQLEEYSLKLKNFNDNYQQYLQQQRKDDMKKRMELQETMRKNANTLMDIYYKKCEFLVDGLKNNIEVAQMKQKVEAAQALDKAKDELKKDIQETRLDWQKQFKQGVEKLTKERENSEEILREAMQQSINNTKRNLSNEIGNNKLEIEEKINEMKAKQVQKQAQRQQKHLQLKNTVLQMLRDQKKLTEQNVQKTKLEMETKMAGLQKIQADKDNELRGKLEAQKKQLETKINTLQKTQLDKDTQLGLKLEAQKQETGTKINALQKAQTDKDAQFAVKLEAHKQEIETKISALQKTQLDKDTQFSLKLQAQKQEIGTKVSALQKAQTDKDAEFKAKLDTQSKQIETKILQLQKTQIDKNVQFNGKLESQKKEIQAKVAALQKIQTDKDAQYNTKIQAQKKQIESKVVALQKNQGDKDVNNKVKLQAQNKQIEAKLDKLQKAQIDKDNEFKTKIEAQKKQIQLSVATQIKKLQDSQKQVSSKTKSGLQQDLTGINKLTKDMTLQIDELKKAKIAMQQQINQLKQDAKTKIAKLQDEKKKTTDDKAKGEQDFKAKESELDKKIATLTQNLQSNYKTINQKIVEINKKMGENLSQLEKEKASNANDGKTKQAELSKKITILGQDIEAKNKQTTAKIDQLNKKLTQIKTNSEKKDGEGKKVGEQSLNQIRSELQKQIDELQARISELQSKDNKGQQNEQSINALRKSVNKLQAMTFSEQAKNKAMFDRLTEDVNKLSENLTLIANQIRQ